MNGWLASKLVMLLNALCLILLIFVNHAFAVRDSFQWYNFKDCREVITEYGLVRGCANERDRLYPFLGIPYAAPPTGSNRFKAPQPAYSWDGILDADHSVKCSQNGEGFEDCLVVNVFTPIREYKNNLIPVLVYLHGGAFITGTSPVDGIKKLVKQDMVVVSVNYRLGILGFLCLGTNDAPGNAGLKDQVAALKWIQRNIEKFGGDPTRVTVYGVDAGGVSIELLILASKSKNLFHRAIVESASATSVSSMDTNPFYTAFKFARKIDVPQSVLNIESLTAYYQKVSPRILSSANYDYYNELIDGTVGFAPCIENRFLRNSEPILIEPPHEILSKGRYEQIPIMFFFTSLEGLFLRSTEYIQRNYKNKVSSNFVDYLPGDLAFDTKEIKAEIARSVAYFYFGKNASEVDIMGYLKFFGDYLVLHGLLNSAELHSRNDNPVYLMEFAYRGRMGGYDKLYDNITLAGHGDVVKHAILDKPFLNRDDKMAVKKIVKIISRFVKYGNPIPERIFPIFPIRWPRVHPGNVSSLYVDNDFRIVDEPHWDMKKFWDNLYATFRIH